MNEDLIKASLDESLLSLAEVEEGGNPDLAVAHATISSALATVAAAEASLIVTLPRPQQRRAALPSTTWMEDIHTLANPSDDDLTPPEPEVVPPVVVYMEPQMPGRGPRRGRARAASPPT